MNPDRIYEENKLENTKDAMNEYELKAYEIVTKVKYHAHTEYSSLSRKIRIIVAFAIGVAISIPVWSYTLMYLWNWFIANNVIGTITPFRAYCIYFAIQFFVFGNIFNVHHINSDRFEIVKQTIKNKATKFDNISLSDSTCVFLYTLYIELKTPLLALLFGYIFKSILYI